MSTVRRSFAGFVLSLLVGGSAFAQKTLTWDALAVRAQLDAAGRLHVVERHTMVFDGDWNGGERRFRVEPGQALTIEGLARVDAAGGVHPMTRGSLVEVDHWDQTGDTVRWRSRLPSDPPFANQRLVYDIRYTLDRVLVPSLDAKRFTLNHDFAFPDRPSAIRDFTLTVTFAPEWRGQWNGPPNVIAARVEGIPAGDGYVLRVPLEFTGAQPPATIPRSELLVRALKPWLIGIPAAILLLLFFRSEWRRRQDSAPAETTPIDHGWLERNLFVYRPEVAGMILDGEVGPPEVAAILATMERDGKLRSTVLPGKKRKPDLELELLVPLDQLEGREQYLAYQLFLGQTTVRASELRKSRKGTGFDLPLVIRESIEREAEEIAPGTTAVLRIRLTAAFFVAGLVALGFGVAQRPSELIALFLLAFGGIGVLLLGFPAAARWKKGPDTIAAIRLVIPAAFLWLLAEGCQRFTVPEGETSGRFTIYGALAVALFLGGFYTILLDAARQRMSRRGMQIQMQLAQAQAWFRGELQKPSPDIRDEWMPWLIALNLDLPVTTWWQTFGGQRGAAASFGRSDDSSSWQSSSTGTSSATSFTAGGGKFGGAGASGSWSAAAAAFAAPIAAPSSHSSSSSSSSSSDSGSYSSSSDSSSSSSGGGGGGGW